MRKICHRSWLNQFFLYNLVFFSLQLLFVFSQQHSFTQTLSLPFMIYNEWIITVLFHLLLYYFISILQFFLFWGLLKQQLSTQVLDYGHVLIWGTTVLTLLTYNAYFFPLSIFSQIVPLPPTLLITILICALFFLSLLFFNTLRFISKRKRYGGLLALLLLGGWKGLAIYQPLTLNSKGKKPTIILIGIDSLNLEHINLNLMPTLSTQLQESVWFKNTISPLARTYPAWTTILTGLYPHHHGARYNLIAPKYVKKNASIAWTLKTKGYQTFFATDDRRFNTMGKSFGFDTIVAPKIGINDFLLGNFNDFPLSNLLVNSPIARWLFPYNYLNRASYVTYYPTTFDDALENTLASSISTAPSLVAIHFTLPHWPYAFGSSLPAEVHDEYDIKERDILYRQALQKVDKQIAHVLSVLKQHGYLAHSMLLFLSDHGEALYHPGSRPTLATRYQGDINKSPFVDYLARKTATPLEKSMGHGSDLLSTTQYTSLLAFKIYEDHHQITSPQVISTRVALIDIAPTIHSFLKLPPHHEMDGISLLGKIKNEHTTLANRAFFMESGMLPNQFINREKALMLAKQFFKVTSTGHLQLRSDALPILDKMKLYAMIKGSWIMALYPDEKGYIPIILHLNDGKWSDIIENSFTHHSPATEMIQALRTFYKQKFFIQKSTSG